MSNNDNNDKKKDPSLPIKNKKKIKTKLKELMNSPITNSVNPDTKVRSDKIEYNNRINEIANLLTVGYTRSYVQEYGLKWSVSERQIDLYIVKAWKKIKEINDLTLQDNLSMVTNQLWDLYRDARANNDRMNANKALAQLAKIKGLEVNTVNHIIEDQRDLVNMTNEDLDNLLNDETNLN